VGGRARENSEARREKMIFEILKAGIGIQRRVDQLLCPAPSK
jgi:hypothetical protein